jgi:DNA sulfur modification protein DndC
LAVPTKSAPADLLVRTLDEIRDVYSADARPWVVGYSGGKDSTTALQLIWHAVAGLPADQRRKHVYVVAGDTRVETPVIIDYLDEALKSINEKASSEGLPFSAHKVVPLVEESFWVNLIGKGYPAPSKRFRWCTERMKINPANRFILERVAEHGEVTLVLGARRQESATRAQVMSLREIKGTHLSRHSSLLNAFVYTPVRDWSVDDVWTYLLQVENPWGRDNRDLLALYQNSQSGECPLVVDTTTPSCGSSRFGCWVCTVVTKDKAMEAMVDNGEEWLEPLLELRDLLAATQDPARKSDVRDHVRRNGYSSVKTFGTDEDPLIRGPYKLDFCQDVLARVLRAEKEVRRLAPEGQAVKLISHDELLEIRRIWRYERHDWQDSLPKIYTEVTGGALSVPVDDGAIFGHEDEALLAELCAEHDLPLGMLKRLLDTERDLQGLARRAGILDRLASVLGQEWRSEAEVVAAITEADAA